jgi:hypothetical protein
MIYRAQTGKYPVRTLSGMFGTGWSGEAERPGTGTRDRDSRWKEIGRWVDTVRLSRRSKVENHRLAILTLDRGTLDSPRDGTRMPGRDCRSTEPALVRLPVNFGCHAHRFRCACAIRSGNMPTPSRGNGTPTCQIAGPEPPAQAARLRRYASRERPRVDFSLRKASKRRPASLEM